jgi:hypothetical protein
VGGMTAAVRQTRGPNELAIQRAAALGVLDPDPYEREVSRAVLAALDWIEGRAGLAPVSADPIEATEKAIHDERVHAEEIEDRALRSGLDGTFPGTVGVVLSWYHCRTFTEAPYAGARPEGSR